jgi:hypothetical protein
VLSHSMTNRLIIECLVLTIGLTLFRRLVCVPTYSLFAYPPSGKYTIRQSIATVMILYLTGLVRTSVRKFVSMYIEGKYCHEYPV